MAFVTRQNRSLVLSGVPWYLYGASNLLEMDDPTGEVQRAIDARLNTLRIVDWLDSQGVLSASTDSFSWGRVDAVLNACANAGIKAVLDLSTYRNLLIHNNINPYTYDWSSFISFAANRVNTVNGRVYKNDDAIAYVAFAGEPQPPTGSSGTQVTTTAQLTSFYSTALGQWRAIDTNHLLCPGGFLHLDDVNSGIDWQSIASLSVVDIFAIHVYSAPDENTTLPAVASYCQGINKPWIVEEFGFYASDGDSTRSTEFQRVYDEAKNNSAAGIAFWNLARDTTPPTYDVNTSYPLTYATVQNNAPPAPSPVAGNAIQKRELTKIKKFTDFLAASAPVGFDGGHIGEVGWPQGKAGSSRTQDQTDAENWKAVGESWYTAADDAGLWVTAWASGAAWGDYNLGIHTASIVGHPLDREMTPGPIDVVEAHPGQNSNVLRGVNISGMDFGVGGAFSNRTPGVAGSDYFVPVAADAAYLAGRNIKLVRLNFLWERLQPTLGGPLDATQLGYLTTFVNACGTNGIGVILDLHNYARYWHDDGSGVVRVLKLSLSPGINRTPDSQGVGRLGVEYFRDVWLKLTQAFRSNTAIAAYDLCNEPHDLSGDQNGGANDAVGAFGVIGTVSAADRQTAKDNGSTHVLIQAFWDRLQPTSAGQSLNATEVANLTGAINDAATKGLKVFFEIAVQYPPTWAQNGIVKFQKQDGTQWTGSQGAGDQIRDWFWTQTGRNYVHDLIAKVMAAVDKSKIDCIKIGGGISGELQYPPEGSASPWSYWAYGAAPQSGTDLATGQTVCPSAVRAPFVPFAAGNAAGDDTTWTNWWLGGIKQFMLWQINEYMAAGYGGIIYVQHPSWGIRSTMLVTNVEYQRAVSKGVDFAGQMAAYASNRQVYPYCTWIDSTGDTTESGAPPWRKLYDLATSYGKTSLIWGENTGGQTNTDMDRVFTTDALPYGYRGVTWLNHSSLADGTTDTYANWQSRIAGANSGTFSGTTRYDWETTTPDAVQGWHGEGTETVSRDTAIFDAGTASLKAQRIVAAGSTGPINIRFNDAGTRLGGTLTGNTLRVRARLAAGTPGSWTLQPEWQNSSYQWQNNGGTALIAGSWVTVTATFPAGITASNAFGCQLHTDDVSAAAGTTVTVNIDTFQQGAGSSSKTIDGQSTWEFATQGALTTVRGNGDTKVVLVPGYGWNVGSWNHPIPWAVEPTILVGGVTTNGHHRYTTHQYFDPDSSGTYDLPGESYANTLAAAQTAGFTSDADATPPTISGLAVGSITTNGAVVSWTTNENADRRVLVRSASQATWFSTTVRQTTLATTHSVTLGNLQPSTTYTVEVRSRDATGNLGKAQFTFTTSGTTTTPVLSSISPVSTPAQTGSAGVRLVLSGNGFTTSTTVLWNGAPTTYPVTFVSASQLYLDLPGSLIAPTGAEPRSYPVNVQ